MSGNTNFQFKSAPTITPTPQPVVNTAFFIGFSFRLNYELIIERHCFLNASVLFANY